MGRKCIVEGCLSDSNREEDIGVTFHKLPSHLDSRNKWFALCRTSEEKRNVKVQYVCSRHFLRANFCNFKGRKYVLKQGILPSVFPWDKSKLEALKSSEMLVKQEEIKEEPPEEPPTEAEAPPAEEVPENSQENKPESPMNIKEEETVEPKREIKTEEMLFDENIKIVPKDVEKSSTTQFGTINFAINNRIEVLDFNNVWYPAKILEVDYEENEVFIHFDKFSSKYDEWICMDSARLRPLQPTRKPVETYAVGERCLATWSDSRKFPATVTKTLGNDTYEVLFDDGFMKSLRAHRMSKAQGKTLQSSPLFDPVKGTKQERREKKRKLNVAALFKKRQRTDSCDTKGKTGETSAVLSEDDSQTFTVKWENGRPVGKESSIDTLDGTKRASIIIDDPRLMSGWEKHFVQRQLGSSAGKWDCLFVSPDNRRFRSKAEIRGYFDTHPVDGYNESMFDFSTGKGKSSLKRQEIKRASVSVTEMEQSEPLVEVKTEPAEEEPPTEESSNLLKIPLVDNAYKCPIEGCGKNFRRENLAQMHVKHYHPEYTKFLDCTPNVADLAYARTVSENLDKTPTIPKPTPPRPLTKQTLKNPNKPISDVDVKPQSPQTPSDMSPKAKDAEIIKLLSTKPYDKKEEPIQALPSGLPANMYPDIKLKDLLSKAEAVPKSNDLNLKSLCSSRPPTGIKTLLPIVRQGGEMEESRVKRKRGSWNESLDYHKGNTISSPQQHPPPLLEQSALSPTNPSLTNTPQMPNNNIIIEGGEVIKIVRMKSEEIINCTCGFTEEDGLMIQCELCLCWQHAYCNNIQRESQVPEKYVCLICQNPMRERASMKYLHDQDWLKHGTLPTASYHTKDNEVIQRRFEKLRKAHDLSGGLLELKEYVNNLGVKLKIAEVKNHPKLYLWSKSWDKPSLPEKTEVKEEDLKLKMESDDLDIKPEQNDSMLMMMLKNETLMDNELPTPIEQPIIPQPEARIDSADCRLNLLDHITHCESLVEERLNDFDRIIDELEKGLDVEKDVEYPRTRQTLLLLSRDLDKLKDFSKLTAIN